MGAAPGKRCTADARNGRARRHDGAGPWLHRRAALAGALAAAAWAFAFAGDGLPHMRALDDGLGVAGVQGNRLGSQWRPELFGRSMGALLAIAAAARRY